MKLVSEWNEKKYDLTANNCIDFVNSVAALLGWTTPALDRTDLPATFLCKLKAANETEETETNKSINGNGVE